MEDNNIIYKNEYEKMDAEYGDQLYKMYGPSLIAFPSGTDASRMNMATQEIKQSLTLINPDIARVQTGFENTFGKRNRAYKQLKGTWVVEDIIQKYTNGNIYMMILYNEETNTYEMIENPVAESLTEKLGFLYNSDFMDNLAVGEIITDPILYRSTAYDEHMNYRYGKSAKVSYRTISGTLEDSIRVRKGWADSVQSAEVDEPTISINENQIPINWYGTEDDYRCMPDIGEPVKMNMPMIVRTINKKHVLIDFQTKNMREPINTDTEYYVNDNNYVYDVDIFYNNPEPFPDSIFFRQLKRYYDQGCEYARRVYEWTVRIKESNANYTKNIPFYKNKYQYYNNPEYKWTTKDGKAFGNMIIIIRTKALVGITPGAKLSGRYGDKGVICSIVGKQNNQINSTILDNVIALLGREDTEEERERLSKSIEIVPDSEMPYTDDFPVDIELNANGAVRRLNTDQLIELDLTFCGYMVQKHLKTLSSRKEQEALIWEFLQMVNEDQYEFFYEMFHYDIVSNGRTVSIVDEDEKERFIQNILDYGFYFRKPPHSTIRYNTIKAIYERFDFIKPLPMYIDIFGTKRRRIMKDGIIGDKYMVVLVHNTNKNFSARSTFHVNRAGLPTKDNTKKNNKSLHSKNPIRIGEAYNIMAANSGRDLAEYNLFMRSSIMARKSFEKIINTSRNPLAIKKLEIKDNYINVNADIFNARLKDIGLRLHFVKDGEETPENAVDTTIMVSKMYGYTIIHPQKDKSKYVKLFRTYLRVRKSVVDEFEDSKLTLDEIDKMSWQRTFDLTEIKDLQLDDMIRELLLVPKLIQETMHDVVQTSDEVEELEEE